MTTQNKTYSLRAAVPKLMHNISILYQNGEITTEEKNNLCQTVKTAMCSNDVGDLHSKFKALRFGTMFPDIVDDCIQLIYKG